LLTRRHHYGLLQTPSNHSWAPQWASISKCSRSFASSFEASKTRLHSDWYYAPADAAWWTRVGGWLERYDRIRWAFSATEAVDFFPLTEHSVDDRSWIAWQWRQVHDGKERGVVQVFRQFACPVSHATLPIYALDPAKHYCKQQPANPDSLLSLMLLPS